MTCMHFDTTFGVIYLLIYDMNLATLSNSTRTGVFGLSINFEACFTFWVYYHCLRICLVACSMPIRADLVSIGCIVTRFTEILIVMEIYSVMTIILIMSSENGGYFVWDMCRKRRFQYYVCTAPVIDKTAWLTSRHSISRSKCQWQRTTFWRSSDKNSQ